MNHRVAAPEQAIDFNNENSNTSANPSFDAVLGARLSRRGLLRGSVGTVGHVDGQGAAAQFSALGQMTTDAAGNLYVIDGLFYDTNKVGPTVRKITPSGAVTTLAGSPTAPDGGGQYLIRA